jgi:hypothetical protein
MCLPATHKKGVDQREHILVSKGVEITELGTAAGTSKQLVSVSKETHCLSQAFTCSSGNSDVQCQASAVNSARHHCI